MEEKKREKEVEQLKMWEWRKDKEERKNQLMLVSYIV